MRLTQRLLLGSLAVITVFIVFAIAIVSNRIARRSLDETIGQLRREGSIIAGDAGFSSKLDSVARANADLSGRRITFIDRLGNVIGDSEIPLPALGQVDNQLAHADVMAALDSNMVRSARYEFGGTMMLHVTVPARVGAVRVSVSESSPTELSRAIQRDLLIAGLIALIIAIGPAWFLAQSVSRPVVELRDVARALADGDLSRRPRISGPGEVGELSQTVHRLSEQLATRLEALHSEEAMQSVLIDSLHEGVIAVDARRRVVRINAAGRNLLELRNAVPFSTDLLPRHRLLREALSEAIAGRVTKNIEIEIESRRVALTARPLVGGGAVVALFDITPIRRLETVRRDFVANVSHELRTPLTIISGFAETLQSSDVPAAKRKEFAALIHSNSARMQRLVDDLLDLSRIESGGWKPQPISIQVEDAIHDIVAHLATAAAAKGLSVDYSVASDARSAFADPVALTQILQNLLENAIRYTSKGSVTISVTKDGEGIRIAVKDTGVGIPAEHLPRIFERFYRVDPGRSREQGGTGLGLAIVRHMTEAHGGSVSALSVPGSGTTVSIFLPLERTAPG